MTDRIAGVELGGAESVAALDYNGKIKDRVVLATKSPGATLAALVERVHLARSNLALLL